VDEVLHAADAVGAEFSSDDTVVSQWNSSMVDFAVASLVNQFGDGLSAGIAVSDEWLHHLEHVPCGLVQLDEYGVVQLSQSEELQDFLWLWCELADTI